MACTAIEPALQMIVMGLRGFLFPASHAVISGQANAMDPFNRRVSA